MCRRDKIFSFLLDEQNQFELELRDGFVELAEFEHRRKSKQNEKSNDASIHARKRFKSVSTIGSRFDATRNGRNFAAK